MSSKRANPMRWLRAAGLALALVAGLAGSAFADGGDAPQAKRSAAERRAELLERYKSLDPEKRKQLKAVFRKRIKALSAQDRKRLRKLASGHSLKSQRQGKHAEAKREFMRQLIGKLSRQERSQLAELEPEERREALRALLGKHRQQVANRTFRLLPPDQQKRLRDELQGLEPGERYRRLRELAGTHMRDKVREILTSDASVEEKQAQLQALLKAMPKPMRDRLKQQIERRMGAGDGRRPPRRGGATPPADGDPPARGEKPQRPQRGGQQRRR